MKTQNDVTVIPDNIIKKYGKTGGLIFSVIARYAKKQGGACIASQERIAKMSDVSRIYVNRWIKTFIGDGLLIDTTPEVKHAPHRYVLTEKGQVLMTIKNNLEMKT